MALRRARKRALSIPAGNPGMIKRGKADKQAARRQRLSAALRENLKRRKQQARDRDAAGSSGPGEASPAGKVAQTEGPAPDFRRNRDEG
jgi:hypothetical protein